MKHFLRNNKGVTVTMFVITIVLMILIASFAVFYSQDVAPEAKLAAAYSSLKEIRDACNRAILEIELDPSTYDEYYFFGNNIRKDGSNLTKLAERCGVVPDAFSERTYNIANDDTADNKRRIERLEISSISESYVVDLENEKYYIVGGVKRANGEIVFEFRDIELMYDMIRATSGK